MSKTDVLVGTVVVGYFALTIAAPLLIALTAGAVYGSDGNVVCQNKVSELNESKQSPLSAVCKVLEPSNIFGSNNFDWNTAKARLTEGKDFTTYAFEAQVVQPQLYTGLSKGREVNFPLGSYLFFETTPTVTGSKTFSPDGSTNRFKGGDFAFPHANPGQVIGIGLPIVLSQLKPTRGVHMYKSTRSPYLFKYAGSGIANGFLNNSDGDFCVNITVNDIYRQDDAMQINELSKVHKDVKCSIVVLTSTGVAKLRTP